MGIGIVCRIVLSESEYQSNPSKRLDTTMNRSSGDTEDRPLLRCSVQSHYICGQRNPHVACARNNFPLDCRGSAIPASMETRSEGNSFVTYNSHDAVLKI